MRSRIVPKEVSNRDDLLEVTFEGPGMQVACVYKSHTNKQGHLNPQQNGFGRVWLAHPGLGTFL